MIGGFGPLHHCMYLYWIRFQIPLLNDVTQKSHRVHMEFTFLPFTKSLFSKKWGRICLTWTWCSATAFGKKKSHATTGEDEERGDSVMYLSIPSLSGWERLNKQLEGSGAPAQRDRSGVSDYLTFLGGEAGGVACHRQFKWWSVIWIDWNNERTTRRKNVFVYLQNQNLIFNHF